MRYGHAMVRPEAGFVCGAALAGGRRRAAGPVHLPTPTSPGSRCSRRRSSGAAAPPRACSPEGHDSLDARAAAPLRSLNAALARGRRRPSLGAARLGGAAVARTLRERPPLGARPRGPARARHGAVPCPAARRRAPGAAERAFASRAGAAGLAAGASVRRVGGPSVDRRVGAGVPGAGRRAGAAGARRVRVRRTPYGRWRGRSARCSSSRWRSPWWPARGARSSAWRSAPSPSLAARGLLLWPVTKSRSAAARVRREPGPISARRSPPPRWRPGRRAPPAPRLAHGQADPAWRERTARPACSSTSSSRPGAGSGWRRSTRAGPGTSSGSPCGAGEQAALSKSVVVHTARARPAGRSPPSRGHSRKIATRRLTMSDFADVEQFAREHAACGGLTPSTQTRPGLGGYLLTITCACGATLDRWVTAEEASQPLPRPSTPSPPAPAAGAGRAGDRVAGPPARRSRSGSDRAPAGRVSRGRAVWLVLVLVVGARRPPPSTSTGCADRAGRAAGRAAGRHGPARRRRPRAPAPPPRPRRVPPRRSAPVAAPPPRRAGDIVASLRELQTRYDAERRAERLRHRVAATRADVERLAAGAPAPARARAARCSTSTRWRSPPGARARWNDRDEWERLGRDPAIDLCPSVKRAVEAAAPPARGRAARAGAGRRGRRRAAAAVGVRGREGGRAREDAGRRLSPASRASGSPVSRVRIHSRFSSASSRR